MQPLLEQAAVETEDTMKQIEKDSVCIDKIFTIKSQFKLKIKENRRTCNLWKFFLGNLTSFVKHGVKLHANIEIFGCRIAQWELMISQIILACLF